MKILFYLMCMTITQASSSLNSVCETTNDMYTQTLQRGMDHVLQFTWECAHASNVLPSCISTFEATLLLNPIGYMKNNTMNMQIVNIPLYDIKDVIETIFIRKGMFENSFTSCFTSPPLHQRIGSLWTLWTLIIVSFRHEDLNNNMNLQNDDEYSNTVSLHEYINRMKSISQDILGIHKCIFPMDYQLEITEMIIHKENSNNRNRMKCELLHTEEKSTSDISNHILNISQRSTALQLQQLQEISTVNSKQRELELLQVNRLFRK